MEWKVVLDKHTQHDRSGVLRAMEHERGSLQSVVSVAKKHKSSENDARSIVPARETVLGTSMSMSGRATPATQQKKTRDGDETCGASTGAFRSKVHHDFTLCKSKIDVFLRVSLKPAQGDRGGRKEGSSKVGERRGKKPQNLQPQNQCFLPGVRQFSSHITECPECQKICTP